MLHINNKSVYFPLRYANVAYKSVYFPLRYEDLFFPPTLDPHYDTIFTPAAGVIELIWNSACGQGYTKLSSLWNFKALLPDKKENNRRKFYSQKVGASFISFSKIIYSLIYYLRRTTSIRKKGKCYIKLVDSMFTSKTNRKAHRKRGYSSSTRIYKSG